MTAKKSAIIIGAGIGGITTSIYLAKNGYDVTVYEKNSHAGGRCGQIIRDGHRFDLGATIFAMPSIYRQVFESLDLKLEDCFEITELSNIVKVYFENGDEISFSTDMSKMEPQLEAIEGGSFKKLQAYVSEGYHFYQMAINKLLARNFLNFFEFFNLKNAWLLIKLKTYYNHFKYAGRFFKNQHLKMAFTFQNIYVGQSPYSAPAFFSMIPSVELKEGSLFLKGGMYSIVEKLVEIATSHGVKFNYNQPISQINTNGKSAKGITLANGSVCEADIIVANAELPYVYNQLLPDKNIAGKINKMKYSCSAMVFHWALDKTYPQLEHHSVFLSEDYKRCMDKIFIDKTTDFPPSFYVHTPTKTDKTAAPDGQDSISVVVPIGHLDKSKDQDWINLKDTIKQNIIMRLKQAGLEDIDKHIKFEICYLPKTWETILNVSKGSVFGSLSHNILQMGYFRPHNKHSKYKNLYFVGGSTHPGNGVPLVLLSAKLTSERILHDSQIN